MAAKRFKTKLTGFYIAVPFDVRKEFGRARPPIKVTVNGYGFPSTVSVYDGRYLIPLRRDRREAAGVVVGDTVKVTVALDTRVRWVKIPPELTAAFRKNRKAKVRWEVASYTRKKEFADVLRAAKRPETRKRRLRRVIEELLEK